MERKLSVVQVGYECLEASGGTFRSVRNFHEVFDSSIVSFTNAQAAKDLQRNSKFLHVPYPEMRVNRYAYAWSRRKQDAAALLRKADLVVCHGFYRYHFDWAVEVARKALIPYWVIPHGSLDPYVFTYRSLQKRAWLRVLGERSFKRASAIIFSTERERMKAERFTGACKTFVIHWPVEEVDTSRRSEAREVIRRKHGIPTNARVLLYVGRLHPMKRPIETIRAVKSCEGVNIHLMVMGPDSELLSAETCKKYCNESGIRNVSIVPPVYGDSRFEYYLAADGFISLSRRENFGYSAAEALSAGLPVILSQGNDLGKDLEGVGCGWILSEGEAGAEETAICEFAAATSARLQEMGENGQKWARSNLSFQMFRQRLGQLVRICG